MSVQAHVCVYKRSSEDAYCVPMCWNVSACAGVKTARCAHGGVRGGVRVRLPGWVCVHAYATELVCAYACICVPWVFVCGRLLAGSVYMWGFASLLIEPTCVSECTCGCVGLYAKAGGGQMWVLCVHRKDVEMRGSLVGVHMCNLSASTQEAMYDRWRKGVTQ